MERIIELTELVQKEVESYARPAIKATAYAMSDVERQQYSVLIVPSYPRKFRAGIVVMARVVGNKVVIEEDTTDRPLVDELVRAGIPREQIICAYIGEKLPEATP
jgi:hypothetical protein